MAAYTTAPTGVALLDAGDAFEAELRAESDMRGVR
jgi:hypothetical protein